MRTRRARRMLEKAREHVGDELPEPPNFDDVTCKRFLRHYLWVIYVCNRRVAVVERHRARLEAEFLHLDLNAIAAMDSIDAQQLPIRDQVRANRFLEGSKLIHAEGWSSFRRRVKKNHRKVLRELPGIGRVTCQHMAMYLGLQDTEKCDIWVKRCAKRCSATVPELVTFLSSEYDLTRLQVDYYLWKYCSDKQALP